MSVIGSPSNLSVLAAWPSLMSLIHRSIIRRNRRVMAYVTPPSILSCDSCPLLFFFFPPFLDTRRLLGRVLVVEYSGVRAEFRDRVSWYFSGKRSLKFLQLRGAGIFKRANLVGQIFFFFLGKYLDSSNVARKSTRSRVDKRICERVLLLCVRMDDAEIFLRGKIRKRLIWPYLTIDRY